MLRWGVGAGLDLSRPAPPALRRCLHMAGLVIPQRNPVIQRFATAANAAYHAASARWVESCMDGVD
jgi:hypothetical protein